MTNGYQYIQEELDQRRKNLRNIRKQLAIYTAGEEPIHLLNKRDIENERIIELEKELAMLGLPLGPSSKKTTN